MSETRRKIITPKLNVIIIAGNLVVEPLLRHTEHGTAILNTRIANSREYWDKHKKAWVEIPLYLDVIVWGVMGERLSKKLHKGMPIIVTGYLNRRGFINKKGEEQWVYEIVTRHIEILDRPEDFEVPLDEEIESSDEEVS